MEGSSGQGASAEGASAEGASGRGGGENAVAQYSRSPLLSPVLDLMQAPVKIQCMGSVPESQANSMMQSPQ